MARRNRAGFYASSGPRRAIFLMAVAEPVGAGERLSVEDEGRPLRHDRADPAGCDRKLDIGGRGEQQFVIVAPAQALFAARRIGDGYC